MLLWGNDVLGRQAKNMFESRNGNSIQFLYAKYGLMQNIESLPIRASKKKICFILRKGNTVLELRRGKKLCWHIRQSNVKEMRKEFTQRSTDNALWCQSRHAWPNVRCFTCLAWTPCSLSPSATGHSPLHVHPWGGDIGAHSVRYRSALHIKIYSACARPTQWMWMFFLAFQTVNTYATKRALHFDTKL